MIPKHALGIVAVEELLGTGGSRLANTYCAAIPRDLAGEIALCMEETKPSDDEIDCTVTRVLGVIHTFGAGPAIVHQNGYRYCKYGIEHRIGGPSSCYVFLIGSVRTRTLSWRIWNNLDRPNGLPCSITWTYHMNDLQKCEAEWHSGPIARRMVIGDYEQIVSRIGPYSVRKISE